MSSNEKESGGGRAAAKLYASMPGASARMAAAACGNLFGMIRVTEAFAPVLAAKAQSAIINVLSIVSWKASPGLTPYSISKAAAWSYTNHARMTLAAQNTRIVGLHVGFVDTDLTAGVDGPKIDPRVVAGRSYDVLEEGGFEVLADEGTAKVKASLSSERPAYAFQG